MKNVLAPVCILVLGLMTNLSASPETEPDLEKLKTLKAEPLSVIHVGDEVKIVRKSELLGLRKEIEAKYRAAVKEYTVAKAEARKAKRKFANRKPVKERLTILAGSVKTTEQAEKLRDKALNDYVVIKSQDKLQVIRKIEFASFKAKTESDYRAALAKYNEAKKAARKNKQSFREPAPVRLKIRVLASRLTSEDAALEKMKALEKKDRESKSRTRSKTRGKGDKKDQEIENVEDEEPESTG